MLRERDTEKVKRSENKVCGPFPLNSPPPLVALPTFSRFVHRTVFASTVLSDAQPSSMVSSAGAVWFLAQRRKSDVRAQPTRSWSWMNHCKASSPLRMVVIPCKTMVRRLPLRLSDAAQSRRCRRRQGHSPRRRSLQDTSTKSCPKSLQKQRCQLTLP